MVLIFFGRGGVWGEGGRVSLKEHQNTLLIFKIKIRKEFQKVIHMMNFNGFGALINFNCYNTISCISFHASDSFILAKFSLMKKGVIVRAKCIYFV